MDDEGASKGGLARAAKLTSEQRRAIAKAAAKARWDKIKNPDGLPEADSDGILTIGEVHLDVYRLKDGRRLSAKGLWRPLLVSSPKAVTRSCAQ